MSVSLRDVLESPSSGYDLNKLEDAQWFLSKRSEIEELLEEAENLIEESEQDNE